MSFFNKRLVRQVALVTYVLIVLIGDLLHLLPGVECHHRHGAWHSDAPAAATVVANPGVLCQHHHHHHMAAKDSGKPTSVASKKGVGVRVAAAPHDCWVCKLVAAASLAYCQLVVPVQDTQSSPLDPVLYSSVALERASSYLSRGPPAIASNYR